MFSLVKLFVVILSALFVGGSGYLATHPDLWIDSKARVRANGVGQGYVQVTNNSVVDIGEYCVHVEIHCKNREPEVERDGPFCVADIPAGETRQMPFHSDTLENVGRSQVRTLFALNRMFSGGGRHIMGGMNDCGIKEVDPQISLF